MGLGANSCDSVAGQLGAAPGVRESATWLQHMGQKFMVAATGGGAARTRRTKLPSRHLKPACAVVKFRGLTGVPTLAVVLHTRLIQIFEVAEGIAVSASIEKQYRQVLAIVCPFDQALTLIVF